MDSKILFYIKYIFCTLFNFHIQSHFENRHPVYLKIYYNLSKYFRNLQNYIFIQIIFSFIYDNHYLLCNIMKMNTFLENLIFKLF